MGETYGNNAAVAVAAVVVYDEMHENIPDSSKDGDGLVEGFPRAAIVSM